MPEWLQQVLTSSIVTGASIWSVQKHLLSKIKHDFDLKLEKIKPLTAEETLRRQNFLNSKRDAYFEAAETLCRHLETTNWSGPDVPKERLITGEKPTEAQINGCLAKLALYTEDSEILREFIAAFENASPASLGSFLNRLRKDLGYGELPVPANKYGYVFFSS
jgi:hypothetical protein